MSNELISCLCVTEDRENFIPWLLWNYNKQTWKNKELIIIDSSKNPLIIQERDDIKVIYTEYKSKLGFKRNMALNNANGKYVAWFDDDDWQHPERLTQLINSINNKLYSGPHYGYFIDLLNKNYTEIKSYEKPFFNGSLFLTEYLKSIGFDNSLHGIEALNLMNNIDKNNGKIIDDIVFFWISHNTNIENPRHRWLMDKPINNLIDKIDNGWGNTSEQLKLLSDKVYN